MIQLTLITLLMFAFALWLTLYNRELLRQIDRLESQVSDLHRRLLEATRHN